MMILKYKGLGIFYLWFLVWGSCGYYLCGNVLGLGRKRMKVLVLY